MAKIERITQLSHRIFNTSLNEKNVSRSSNPFANFQKNVLNADVLELSSKKDINISGGITQCTKRIYSTFVGSINDFGKRFYEGIEKRNEFESSFSELINEIESGNIVISTPEGETVDAFPSYIEYVKDAYFKPEGGVEDDNSVL